MAETRTRVKCPECGGTGVDASDRPVVFVITMDKDGTTQETPCVMCFGHGTIIAVDKDEKSC